jgi:uncharacterized membrane protein
MVKTGEWMSEAWELVKQDLWMHVLVVLLIGIASSASVSILSYPLACGYIYIIIRKLQEPGYTPEIGDVGKGFEVFVPALLAGIVGGIIAGLGIIACIVGVFVTSALVMFAMPLVMDRRMEFWPAIQASMDLVKQNLVAWSVFVLALTGVYLLGIICCGVGVLVAAPVCAVSVVLAYRDNFGFAGAEAAAPTEPPTPTE